MYLNSRDYVLWSEVSARNIWVIQQVQSLSQRRHFFVTLSDNFTYHSPANALAQ